MSGPRRFSRWFWVTLLVMFATAPEAAAAPQASAGLLLGGGTEAEEPLRARGILGYLGGRADVLFGRGRGADMAVGPYMEAATLGFRDTELAAGCEWLLPIRDDIPIVLSGGAVLKRDSRDEWLPGMEGTVFYGSRSLNFHSWYGLAAGLFAQALWAPGQAGAAELVLGARVDAELLAMPWLLVWGLFK